MSAVSVGDAPSFPASFAAVPGGASELPRTSSRKEGSSQSGLSPPEAKTVCASPNLAPAETEAGARVRRR